VLSRDRPEILQPPVAAARSRAPPVRGDAPHPVFAELPEPLCSWSALRFPAADRLRAHAGCTPGITTSVARAGAGTCGHRTTMTATRHRSSTWPRRGYSAAGRDPILRALVARPAVSDYGEHRVPPSRPAFQRRSCLRPLLDHREGTPSPADPQVSSIAQDPRKDPGPLGSARGHLV